MMEETNKKPTNGKPKPHSQIIKDIDKRIIRLEATIADRDRKRNKPFISWMKKRQNPKMWEDWGKSIDVLRARVKSEKERKRILEIELEEFGRIRRDEAITLLVEKFPDKNPEDIRQDVMRGWKERESKGKK